MLHIKIKNLREQRSLTQEQLADKLNISPSTIGMYEQGRRQPTLDTLIKISNIFQTPINTFLNIEEKFYIKSIQIDNIIIELIDFIQHQECVLFKGKKLNSEEVNQILYVLKLVIK